MEKTTISIASDHGGRLLKNAVIKHLEASSWTLLDHGVDVDEEVSVDYPDYATKVAEDLMNGVAERGMLICGTGIGMSIAANKFPGIRATLVWDEFTARMSRAHNNSNILVLGERVLNHDRALDLVDIWLSTKFEARHQARLDKVESLAK